MDARIGRISRIVLIAALLLQSSVIKTVASGSDVEQVTAMVEQVLSARTGVPMRVRLLWPARACADCQVSVTFPDGWRALSQPRGSALLRSHGRLVANVPFEATEAPASVAARPDAAPQLVQRQFPGGGEVRVVYQDGALQVEGVGRLQVAAHAGGQATVRLPGGRQISGIIDEEGVLYVK